MTTSAGKSLIFLFILWLISGIKPIFGQISIEPPINLYPDYQSYKFESIEIQGPLDFINMIYDGLVTLRSRSYKHYEYVCSHTKRIIFVGTGDEDETIAFTYIKGNARGCYDIYFVAKTLSVNNSADYGPLIGSLLVHESAHLAGWDEPMAYYLQVEALKHLNASPEMINYWETEFAPLIELKDVWQ